MNFLGWIDHDGEQEDAILKALAAAKGQDARDELGLGTIRDSFADLFFPGLSTIQQRVRYFLFVQWCCELAAKKSEADQILSKLRENEEALIQSLKHLGEGHGVIGVVSEEDLARMPSEIYWNGLAVLGMRRVRGGRPRWSRHVVAARMAARADNLTEEGGISTSDIGFDLDRPPPPKGFPQIKGLDFELDDCEAAFLRRRLANACVDSEGRGHEYNLFGTLLLYRRKTAVRAPWDHPRVQYLKPSARDMLMLGAAFSKIMHGATTLYNVCVARLMPPNDESARMLAGHENALRDWADGLNPADVKLLTQRLRELPGLGAMTRHRVDDKTMLFVERWTTHCTDPLKLLSDPQASQLVANREVFLKSANGTSRINFSKQRERWAGESGSQQMNFRWNTARSCLNDLAKPPNA